MKLYIRILIGFFISLMFVIFGGKTLALNNIDKNKLITSFYFHNPPSKLFNQLLNWLIKHDFNFVSADELFMILSGEKQCPKRAIFISFDDARKELIQNVIPIISEKNIPITIFTPVNSIIKGTFWWSYLNENKNLIRNIVEFHKLSNKKKLELVSVFEKKNRPRDAFSIEELKEASRNPLITIGGHTMNHFSTVKSTDEELYNELNESKIILEQWTGKKIKYFAYPHGFFNGTEYKILNLLNYKMSFTTVSNYISQNSSSNLHYLPRFSCFDKGTYLENICRLLGIWKSK